MLLLVALVRGDRFYTVDYNSATLTNWGYQDVQPDVEGGSYGGMIGKVSEEAEKRRSEEAKKRRSEEVYHS